MNKDVVSAVVLSFVVGLAGGVLAMDIATERDVRAREKAANEIAVRAGDLVDFAERMCGEAGAVTIREPGR